MEVIIADSTNSKEISQQIVMDSQGIGFNYEKLLIEHLSEELHLTELPLVIGED